jgi:hypothetical protein
MNHSKLGAFVFLGAVLLVSCKVDIPDGGGDSGFQHGVFITNEGAFGNSNGSISYFDADSSKMINHLFESVNGRPLGDVVQSITLAGDKGFIVVNNSQKMEIVDLKTFTSIGVIDGLEYPRYFVALDDKKGYLTDGNFTGRVYVIDLVQLKIKDTIPCGSGPEKMLLHNKSLYVTNSGGWGNDSTLTIIDTQTDLVKETRFVGMNPIDLVLDNEQQIWVLCKGKVVMNPDWSIAEETASSLVVMNPASGAITKTIEIGSIGDFYWPQRMGINKKRDLVYYLEAEGIFSRAINGNNSQLLVSRS